MHPIATLPACVPIRIDTQVDGSPPSQPGGRSCIARWWNWTSQSSNVIPTGNGSDAPVTDVSVPAIAIVSKTVGLTPLPAHVVVAGDVVQPFARPIE